ncbi:MAG: hypothetical protein HRJ53_07540 [Acidobacteria bacterium Pan2503]|uniref:Uncharacterized protein n=1 Tax=Candidatus Acidiferrum panamense TaxID=2741543 RepID=A0A7V8NP65_9BACT|nr:hypothetical protein [Candidatus Acidoferrum panamensis]
MAEQAYPPEHPAHPDNAGKPYISPGTPITNDYPAKHPARGGQGQAIPTEGVTGLPRQGFRHLRGLEGKTLAELEQAFAELPQDEQAARLKWNQEGFPAHPDKE